jgi:hypothetical protein
VARMFLLLVDIVVCLKCNYQNQGMFPSNVTTDATIPRPACHRTLCSGSEEAYSSLLSTAFEYPFHFLPRAQSYLSSRQRTSLSKLIEPQGRPKHSTVVDQSQQGFLKTHNLYSHLSSPSSFLFHHQHVLRDRGHGMVQNLQHSQPLC